MTSSDNLSVIEGGKDGEDESVFSGGVIGEVNKGDAGVDIGREDRGTPRISARADGDEDAILFACRCLCRELPDINIIELLILVVSMNSRYLTSYYAASPFV